MKTRRAEIRYLCDEFAGPVRRPSGRGSKLGAEKMRSMEKTGCAGGAQSADRCAAMTPELNPLLELSPLIDELKQRKETIAQGRVSRRRDE